MLRLPQHRYHRPATVEDAVQLLVEHDGDARLIAGGTDVVPNMKHGLFEEGHLVSLKGIPELETIDFGSDEIVVGAGVTLSALSSHPQVRLELPALAEAARHVASPQIRNRATVGGNLCLDTRCTYYNQTHFWREALGYCLKKDGDTCHVTRVGKKCVAAHSADTPPVLAVLQAEAELVGPGGARSIPVADFFVADGVWNLRRSPNEVVTRIRIPKPSPNRYQAYKKLRQRQSIDSPLVTVAASMDLGTDGTIEDLRMMVTALGSRPRMLSGLGEITGDTLDEESIEFVAARAFKQCHPLENIIVDPEWRRAMVPVYVRRALEQLRDASQGQR